MQGEVGGTHAFPALVDAYEKMRGFQESARSKNTKRAYASDWNHFATWCGEHDLSALSAAPASVALYLSTYAESFAVATLSRRLVAISERHRAIGEAAPVAHRVVVETWEGIKRRVVAEGRTTRAKTPVLPSDFRQMLYTLPPGVTGDRDRALLLIGWYGGFRPAWRRGDSQRLQH